MNSTSLIRRYPITAFFVLAFFISWGGSLLAAGPEFFGDKPIPLSDFMLMFLAMLAGPSIAGVVLTAVMDGQSGLDELTARMRNRDVETRWYIVALLLPPVLIIGVLVTLTALASPMYMPALNLTGLAYGLLAGFFEEIGWMGYAYPRMERRHSPLAAGLILGLLWGLWYTMAGYLGASGSLGVYWLLNFLSLWVGAMVAIRILIVWLYRNTQSIWMTQLMHASFTGFLAMLAPVAIPPARETFWHIVFAVVLWIVVALVIAKFGAQLREEPAKGYQASRMNETSPES